MELTDTPVARLNVLHARRAQGIPTVAVLVGPVGLGERAWREWNEVHRRSVVRAAGAVTELALSVTARLLATDTPVSAAVNWLAAAQQRPPAELAAQLTRMTRYDLEHLWSQLPVDVGTPAAVAARVTLLGRVLEQAPDAGEWVRAVTDDTRRPAAGAIFAAWAGLLPDADRPALLLVPPAANRNGSGWLDVVLRDLQPVLEAVPRWPVAVAVPDAEYRAFTATTEATRQQMLAREGFVPVRGVTEAVLVSRLAAVGEPAPARDTLLPLLADGLSEDTAAAFVVAARATRSAAADAARSEAERFLYQHLNDDPETAGLFRLNCDLDFRHGPRNAEADLASVALRVVIEIDGGYYHLTPDQYRRDRRKDWSYQRHGYLVLRFLAEDVVRDLTAIRATVAEAVALRRSPATLKEVP